MRPGLDSRPGISRSIERSKPTNGPSRQLGSLLDRGSSDVAGEADRLRGRRSPACGAPATLRRGTQAGRRPAARPLQRVGTRDRVGSHAATITSVGALAVSTGAGVFAIALADTAARFGSPVGEPLFWLGLATLFVPLAFRLVVSRVPRGERLGATLLLVGGMYLVKVVHGPIRFVFFDEFSHLRTASDILASGRLFEPNPLLTVSPLYPGLEVATNAIASLAGVSVGDAGFVVIGAARIALALGLFLLLEHVSGSSRVAALGSLVYAGNPNFAFWSSQYAYESLALPLAIG